MLFKGGGGGGVQAAKYFGKHDFEIMVDPKSTPSGANFLGGFGVLRPNGATVAPAPKNRPKWRIFLKSNLGAI